MTVRFLLVTGSAAFSSESIQIQAEAISRTFDIDGNLNQEDQQKISKLGAKDSGIYFEILLNARAKSLTPEETAFIRAQARAISFIPVGSNFWHKAGSSDRSQFDVITADGKRQTVILENEGKISIFQSEDFRGSFVFYLLAFHELEHALQRYRASQSSNQKLKAKEYRYLENVGVTYVAEESAMSAEPGVAEIIEQSDHTFVSVYNDKAGNKEFVSSDNLDILNSDYEKNWDKIFTPYALFMAATSHPLEFLPIFAHAQAIVSGKNSLYVPGMGWMDGIHLTGSHTGRVVPAQLALNQGMIALALMQMQSADGMSSSGRALHNNPNVSAHLAEFYQLFEKHLNLRKPNY